jgi:circadian clock protein KaiB
VKRHGTGRATKSFEKALAAGRAGRYVLRLYIAGATQRSRRALARVRHLCDVDLQGKCDLEVIDIYQQPARARDGQIIATPTLVKEFPPPMRRFIGSLESSARLFIDLDLQTRGETGA